MTRWLEHQGPTATLRRVVGRHVARGRVRPSVPLRSRAMDQAEAMETLCAKLTSDRHLREAVMKLTNKPSWKETLGKAAATVADSPPPPMPVSASQPPPPTTAPRRRPGVASNYTDTATDDGGTATAKRKPATGSPCRRTARKSEEAPEDCTKKRCDNDDKDHDEDVDMEVDDFRDAENKKGGSYSCSYCRTGLYMSQALIILPHKHWRV